MLKLQDILILLKMVANRDIHWSYSATIKRLQVTFVKSKFTFNKTILSFIIGTLNPLTQLNEHQYTCTAVDFEF